MIVFRIVKANYSCELRASGRAARWNQLNEYVLYCAESIALAYLENIVHFEGYGFRTDYVILDIEVPDDTVTLVDPTELPPNWRNFESYANCQPLGSAWYQGQESLLLKVPSVIVPRSFNYVINTRHPEFNRVKIAAVDALDPDERMEQLLRAKRKTS